MLARLRKIRVAFASTLLISWLSPLSTQAASIALTAGEVRFFASESEVSFRFAGDGFTWRGTGPFSLNQPYGPIEPFGIFIPVTPGGVVDLGGHGPGLGALTFQGTSYSAIGNIQVLASPVTAPATPQPGNFPSLAGSDGPLPVGALLVSDMTLSGSLQARNNATGDIVDFDLYGSGLALGGLRPASGAFPFRPEEGWRLAAAGYIITPIPEPSTCLLLTSGLAAIVAMRRRRGLVE